MTAENRALVGELDRRMGEWGCRASGLVIRPEARAMQIVATHRSRKSYLGLAMMSKGTSFAGLGDIEVGTSSPCFELRKITFHLVLICLETVDQLGFSHIA